MPLPSPNSGETREDYLNRCMSNPTMTSEYGDDSQRFAVCVSRWDGSGSKALADMRAILSDQDFWNARRARMLERMEPVFVELFLLGALMAVNELPAGLGERALSGRRQLPGLPFDFDGLAGAASNLIGQYSDQWWRMIDETQRRTLRNALQTAEDEGLDPDWVMTEIEPVFGARRSELIAVSESTNLMGMGAQETYRQAGFNGWIWRTVRDAFVDPVCVALARESDPALGGEPFPITRPFMRAHAGCRCFIAPAGDPSAESMMSAMLSPPPAVNLGPNATFEAPELTV